MCCVVAVFAGCSASGSATRRGAPNREADSVAGSGPVLYDVTPDSVPAGDAYPVTLMIRGEGFDSEGNVLRLGDTLADTVSSLDGTSIRWSMPKTVRSYSEVPPMVVQPGKYDLTVQTREGVSNALVVTVLPER